MKNKLIISFALIILLRLIIFFCDAKLYEVGDSGPNFFTKKLPYNIEPIYGHNGNFTSSFMFEKNGITMFMYEQDIKVKDTLNNITYIKTTPIHSYGFNDEELFICLQKSETDTNKYYLIYNESFLKNDSIKNRYNVGFNPYCFRILDEIEINKYHKIVKLKNVFYAKLFITKLISYLIIFFICVYVVIILFNYIVPPLKKKNSNI